MYKSLVLVHALGTNPVRNLWALRKWNEAELRAVYVTT